MSGYEVNDDRLPELKKNQALELILTVKSINLFGSDMLYTIGGQRSVNYMQKNLMVQTNISSVF